MSALLQNVVAAFPPIKSAVDGFLNDIVIREARADNASNMFADPEKYPAIQETKNIIAVCESRLEDNLKDIRKSLKKPSLSYVTVAGIEVSNHGKLPGSTYR